MPKNTKPFSASSKLIRKNGSKTIIATISAVILYSGIVNIISQFTLQEYWIQVLGVLALIGFIYNGISQSKGNEAAGIVFFRDWGNLKLSTHFIIIGGTFGAIYLTKLILYIYNNFFNKSTKIINPDYIAYE